jgi:hypothetical protein
MASAKGRLLTDVSGSIENGKAHYGFVRNGKQFIACLRKGYNGHMTDAQKIQCVAFSNHTRTANAIWAWFKDSENAQGAAVIAGVCDKATIEKNFYAQTRDENGYYKPHATIKDYISGELVKHISDDNKKAIIEAVGKEYFTEDLDGYEALKKA